MPRLFGFVPTKKMLAEQSSPLVVEQVVHTELVVDVIHDGPIIDTLPPHELNKNTVLSPLPSNKKNSSKLKRKVNLNPLSDE